MLYVILAERSNFVAFGTVEEFAADLQREFDLFRNFFFLDDAIHLKIEIYFYLHFSTYIYYLDLNAYRLM